MAGYRRKNEPVRGPRPTRRSRQEAKHRAVLNEKLSRTNEPRDRLALAYNYALAAYAASVRRGRGKNPVVTREMEKATKEMVRVGDLLFNPGKE